MKLKINEWFFKNEEIILEIPGLKPIKLDEICFNCNSEWLEEQVETENCPLCNKVGYRITDAGKAILGLIIRYGETYYENRSSDETTGD